jgi:hypothetical protein
MPAADCPLVAAVLPVSPVRLLALLPAAPGVSVLSRAEALPLVPEDMRALANTKVCFPEVVVAAEVEDDEPVVVPACDCTQPVTVTVCARSFVDGCVDGCCAAGAPAGAPVRGGVAG